MNAIRPSMENLSIDKGGLAGGILSKFIDQVFGVASSHPEIDVKALCGAWQTVTKADSVWLLLKNDYIESEPWEIVGQTTELKHTESKFTFNPNIIAEVCLKKAECIITDDYANWNSQFDGVEYSIPWKASLAELGCKTLCCIPLLKPVLPPRTGPDWSPCPAPEGAVVLVFKNTPQATMQESFLSMGKISAFAISNSYLAEQRKILVTLNQLAERFLTRVARSISQLRSEYLEAIVKLIKDSINVEAVSIFYRDISGMKVECLYSTGICNSNLIKVQSSDLSNVTYKLGEGLTGKCFQSARPIILTEARREPHYPKFLEMPKKEALKTLPAVFYPIISPTNNESAALGVIRCAFHNSKNITNGLRRFDPMTVQTLGFIATQIGPVLHIFDSNIRREQTISITKHDLRTPLQMAEDSLAALEEAGENTLILKNLRSEIEVALNLVHQLEPDPQEIKDFDPVPTFLEGDIVARLKAMLSHVAWESRKMKIFFNDFSNVPQVRVDRLSIERVFTNLIMNAIKYGKPGSEINIVPGRGIEGFLIHIINEGTGITEEEAQHIFKPNYRAPSTKSFAMGSGLGLTIARAAMEKHGGKLVLTKRRDPTVFSMFFPRQLIVEK